MITVNPNGADIKPDFGTAHRITRVDWEFNNSKI